VTTKFDRKNLGGIREPPQNQDNTDLKTKKGGTVGGNGIKHRIDGEGAKKWPNGVGESEGTSIRTNRKACREVGKKKTQRAWRE